MKNCSPDKGSNLLIWQEILERIGIIKVYIGIAIVIVIFMAFAGLTSSQPTAPKQPSLKLVINP